MGVLLLTHLISSLRLLGVAETRFASTLILVKRIREVREALCQMVVDPNWRFLKDDDAEKARKIKLMLVDDQWWERIDFLISFTNPIVKLLRETDTDTPMLHLVYEKWDCMIEQVREIIHKNGNRNPIDDAVAFYEEIYGILVRRWTKSTIPLHCLAHCLNPTYYSEEWLLQSPDRVPPHRDSEISDGRNAAFERLFPCESELNEVRREYGQFAACEGYFGQLHVKQGRYISSPQTWWGNHGSHAPRLAKLADRLLCQPSSSSCCERNWSTYSQIKTAKRNKLTAQRADDLVFIHSNLRLLSRKKNEYVEGPCKYWDINGDDICIDEAIDLEVANCSLEDPTLVGVSFGSSSAAPTDKVGDGTNRLDNSSTFW